MANSYQSKSGTLTYRIEDNGYYIDLNGTPWIYQYEPFIPNHNLSYEENAIAQIEEIIRGEEAAEAQISQQDRIEQAVAAILANQMLEG